MYYNNLNKNELIELCKKRGLSYTGNKSDLVSRLIKSDRLEEIPKGLFTQIAIENELDEKSIKIIENISKRDNFYLHLKSSNLSNYFTFGYFYPIALEESEIYKNENRTKDILSYFEEYIIVGKAPINTFESSDVLVELVLNGIKANEHEKSGLFYITEPIPISRVKTIFFKTAAAKATFLSSVKTFPDSFIPSSICEIISEEDEKPEEIDIDNIKLPKNESLSEWNNRLYMFDKVLGLFAFIKNVSVFYSERENKFNNYSSGFFSALNLINLTKQLSAYRENVYLKPLFHYRDLEINSAQRVIFKSVVERVYNNKTIDLKAAIQILESSVANEHAQNGEFADIKEQIKLFKQLDNLTLSFKELLQKEVIRKDQNLPALALLFLSKFPNKSRQHTDKQAVRNIFIQNEFAVPLNVAEYVLGFLGLYYGYRSMIKEDTNLKFSDKNFEQLATITQSIKFKLENYFERFIIESAFQFAAHQKVLNDSFDFLNWSNKIIESKPLVLSSSYQYEYSDKSTAIMGQEIYNIVRQDKTEKIFEQIANQYSDNVENSSYLAAFFAKHFNLNKWHILDILKKNKGHYPMNELEDVVNLDNKTKKK